MGKRLLQPVAWMFYTCVETGRNSKLCLRLFIIQVRCDAGSFYLDYIGRWLTNLQHRLIHMGIVCFWRLVWVSEAPRRRTQFPRMRLQFCFFSISGFEASIILIGWYLSINLVAHYSSSWCRHGQETRFSLHSILHSYHEPRPQWRDKSPASRSGQFRRLSKDEMDRGKVDVQGNLFPDSLPHLFLFSRVKRRALRGQLVHS